MGHELRKEAAWKPPGSCCSYTEATQNPRTNGCATYCDRCTACGATEVSTRVQGLCTAAGAARKPQERVWYRQQWWKKQVSAEMGFEQTDQKFPRKTPGVSGNGAKMGGNERFYEKSARAELSSERTELGGSDCSRSGIWLN
jgi:hypothetical protein